MIVYIGEIAEMAFLGMVENIFEFFYGLLRGHWWLSLLNVKVNLI